jgi:hypothetical protein
MELTFVLVLSSGVLVQQMPKSWHGAGECGPCRHGIDKDRQVIIWVAELVFGSLPVLVLHGQVYRLHTAILNRPLSSAATMKV